MEKSVVVFGMTRGGSSISNRLLQLLAKGSGWELIDLGGEAYREGTPLDEISENKFKALPLTRALLGPFRNVPRNSSDILGPETSKAIIVRDPRDCLVSHFFAFTKFHSKLGGASRDEDEGNEVASKGIDAYVLSEADSYADVCGRYINLIDNFPNTFVWRYEDIAYSPIAWLNAVIENFELAPGSGELNQAVIEAYFWRVGEDRLSHNRSGQPGDYARLLKADTIQQLDKKFDKFLSRFDYNHGPSATYERFAAEVRDPQALARLVYEQRVQIDELKRAVHELMRVNGVNAAAIKNLRAKISGE